MYASGLCFASMWCQGFVYRSVTGHGWVARLCGSFLACQVAPKSLRDFGGIDLSMGRFKEPGGRSDRLIGPEGQLGLLD